MSQRPVFVANRVNKNIVIFFKINDIEISPYLEKKSELAVHCIVPLSASSLSQFLVTGGTVHAKGLCSNSLETAEDMYSHCSIYGSPDIRMRPFFLNEK